MLHTSRQTRGLAGRSLLANTGIGWRIVLGFVLLLTFLLSAHAPARAGYESYVATDVLMLRDGPSTDADILAEMGSGAYLWVIDGPTEHGWYFVDFAGLQGWAHGQYLSSDGDSGGSVGGGGASAWVDTDALNVRDGPSTDSAQLGTVVLGDELWVTGDGDNGFYPVSFGDGTGWVAGEYLSWSAVGGGSERWISVDRGSSTISLMVGDEPIGSYWAAMGYDSSDDGFYATALGTYYIYEKHADLSWTEWARGYIQFWVGFDPDRFNGFHSWTMDKRGRVIEGGSGPTGGCVALDPEHAAIVYDFAEPGMRVEVHW